MMNLRHWYGKLFKGKVTEEAETASGDVLRRYASGYTEHVDKTTGIRTDVERDLYRRRKSRRLWKCSRTQGGGMVEFHDLTRAEAERRCAAELGTVIYIDDYHGFIFYRDGAGNGVAETNAPLPR